MRRTAGSAFLRRLEIFGEESGAGLGADKGAIAMEP
jgi:hypothetical protein